MGGQANSRTALPVAEQALQGFAIVPGCLASHFSQQGRQDWSAYQCPFLGEAHENRGNHRH